MSAGLRSAIFLDRDGTLMEEVEYCGDPDKVHVFPGTAEALAKANAAGWLLVIITNQSGIGRGYFSMEDFEKVQVELMRQLRPAKIDATYCCSDHPDQAGPRRKPAPGMLMEAAAELGVDLASSWMIGDKSGDIEAGRRAGAHTLLVHSGYGHRAEERENAAAEKESKDIVAAIGWILGNCRPLSAGTIADV